ncbi:helix-turn-helix transcriptional regulator [Amycolatopsis sp. CA-126428]|uniref:helix-turn-helix transcriptional regulator n=1 Tax=Amycolatopsis sp. CA-126428 TaxID=2073158 RepID=UPI000CD0109D|nr:helix-turn-helix transcriptional regulator [Amycolatopsis sp. CA-126428]
MTSPVSSHVRLHAEEAPAPDDAGGVQPFPIPSQNHRPVGCAPESDKIRRRELADFLRKRRESTDPAELGLHRGARRRTPGLRREEIAVLAGMSPTWYTYLEQARSVSPSAKNLDGIADVLRLSDGERVYLSRLAQRDPMHRPATEQDSARLWELTKALNPLPALATSRFGDVLGWNDAAVDQYGDFGRMPDAERNLLWWMFTADAARERIVDWEAEARAQVARLRWAAAGWYGHPRLDALVGALAAASDSFRAWWDKHAVYAPGDRIVTIRHARSGEQMTTRVLDAWQDDLGDARLVLHVPG